MLSNPSTSSGERSTLHNPIKTGSGYELHPHSVDGSVRFPAWQKWHHVKLGNKIQTCSSLRTSHKPTALSKYTFSLQLWKCKNLFLSELHRIQTTPSEQSRPLFSPTLLSGSINHKKYLVPWTNTGASKAGHRPILQGRGGRRKGQPSTLQTAEVTN